MKRFFNLTFSEVSPEVKKYKKLFKIEYTSFLYTIIVLNDAILDRCFDNFDRKKIEIHEIFSRNGQRVRKIAHTQTAY